jgi:phytoene synthase
MNQPTAPTPSLQTAHAQDLRACVQLMRGGSKTFFAASRLLPARVRDASIALYAFCRVADDLVDEGDGSTDSLAQLTARLDAIYAGHPHDLVEDRALAAVVHLHQLPRPLLDALLEGFAWDAQDRRYDTLEDVQAYGARVAGSVGAMMCWLMGVRCPEALARACELGVAMQLTNIARDVGADARIARLYLPAQWLREAGIEPRAWLSQPQCSPVLQGVVERLLREADRLYAQASLGIAALPADCRPAILAARLIYAEIGHQLRRDGLNPLAHRAVVPSSRKVWLLARACLQSRFVSPTQSQPTSLQATAYLVDICARATAESVQSQTFNTLDLWQRPRRSWGQRAVWMLELFERQEQLRRQRKGLSFLPDRTSMTH